MLKDAEAYSQKINAPYCGEVSAKDGTGISELFKQIAIKMHEQLVNEHMDSNSADQRRAKQSIKLNPVDMDNSINRQERNCKC